jgi:hypothetical protein
MAGDFAIIAFFCVLISHSVKIPPPIDEQQQTSMIIASVSLEETEMAPNRSIHMHVTHRPAIFNPSFNANPVYTSPSAPVVA